MTTTSRLRILASHLSEFNDGLDADCARSFAAYCRAIICKCYGATRFAEVDVQAKPHSSLQHRTSKEPGNTRVGEFPKLAIIPDKLRQNGNAT
jgi:hypothetical protein